MIRLEVCTCEDVTYIDRRQNACKRMNIDMFATKITRVQRHILENWIIKLCEYEEAHIWIQKLIQTHIYSLCDDGVLKSSHIVFLKFYQKLQVLLFFMKVLLVLELFNLRSYHLRVGYNILISFSVIISGILMTDSQFINNYYNNYYIVAKYKIAKKSTIEFEMSAFPKTGYVCFLRI